MTDITHSSSSGLILLNPNDKARLEEAIQELLVHGSILGLEPGQGELYDWCRQNPDWLREAAALVGLTIYNEHESRMVQAIPRKSALTLSLKQDATLVLLALWYEYDTQVRDQGATEVRLTVEQLNQLLKEKLLPDLKSQPSAGRMREILVIGRRYNLVRVEFAEPFEKSTIEVLPTLKKVIQFNDIEEWNKLAAMHQNPLAGQMAERSLEEGGNQS
ncbi:MAG: DUF4194 domain-containing protein [Limisphaerales bacterium]